MSRYTKDDIFRMVEEEDVEFIRLQFTDIFGTLKNIAITSSQLEKALDNKCMFDGSSVEGFVRIEESDMYLYPDYDTFEIFPWRPQQGKVARLICDVHTPDGKPFEGDPRWILKKTIKEANEMGYRFDVGPECEFFLFHTDDNGLPTTLSHEKAGYFDLGPNDLGENIRRDMVLTLEDMGFEIEASHHEVAPAQHEIDFKYDEALKTADNIQTFKMTVKTIAKRHGLYATFMPKPKFGISGSGMHINMSLATEEGKNIFADENGKIGLSDDAYHFIAGIMKHARGMSAITNPLVNSYKRLVPGYEAPVYIAWSAKNRSPLIRIRLKGLHFHIRAKLSFIVFVSLPLGTLSFVPVPAHSNSAEPIIVIIIAATINPFCAFVSKPKAEFSDCDTATIEITTKPAPIDAIILEREISELLSFSLSVIREIMPHRGISPTV